MFKTISCILLVIMSLTTVADDAIVLSKGSPAPFDGYLITKDKGSKIFKLGADLDFQTQKAALLQNQVDLLKTQNTNNIEYIGTLSKRVEEQKDNSIWGKVGMFFLGAACATMIAYGSSRVVK